MKRPLTKIVVAFVVFSVFTAMGVFLYFAAQLPHMPSFKDIRASYGPSEAFLLDRSGLRLHSLRVDKGARRLGWVSLKDISPALLRAVVRSEDKRFYSHAGVDVFAAGKAFYENAFSDNKRGASTITMQVASIVDNGFKAKRTHRSYSQKLRQIGAAFSIERGWSKAEILEAYLNLAVFRGELQGVASASVVLFGKDPHGLSDAESIVLASLIRSPNALPPVVKKRAYLLAAQLGAFDVAKAVAYAADAAFFYPPGMRGQPGPAGLAPHAARLLLTPGKGGEKTRSSVSSTSSTLDAGLQRFVADVLREQLLLLKRQNVKDGAALVVDNATGDVLAYVGSSGDLSDSPFVDGVKARRQAGSTLKPFLYGLVIEKRLLTAASVIDDGPLDIPVSGGLYRPMNYDNTFRGPVTVRTALASSLNVPAVKTLKLSGVGPFLKRLRELGITGIDEDDDFYGPSLALGSIDVSLLEMTNAYRTLANQGVYGPLTFIPGHGSMGSRRVFSKEAAFIVSDILSDRAGRAASFGLENPLTTRKWSAVKTGTSKDMRDNWCIGFSSRYTVGVWVGNFSGEPMWNVSGVSGAAPVWLAVMNRLHERTPSVRPAPPSGVWERKMDLAGMGEARGDWFIKGTEPDGRVNAVFAKGFNRAGYRIIYPAKDTIIAIDPDMPEGVEKVFFEAEPVDSGLKWVLDGKEAGLAAGLIAWTPESGRHVLSLVDKDGGTVDKVDFLVRGAPVHRFP